MRRSLWLCSSHWVRSFMKTQTYHYSDATFQKTNSLTCSNLQLSRPPTLCSWEIEWRIVPFTFTPLLFPPIQSSNSSWKIRLSIGKTSGVNFDYVFCDCIIIYNRCWKHYKGRGTSPQSANLLSKSWDRCSCQLLSLMNSKFLLCGRRREKLFLLKSNRGMTESLSTLSSKKRLTLYMYNSSLCQPWKLSILSPKFTPALLLILEPLNSFWRVQMSCAQGWQTNQHTWMRWARTQSSQFMQRISNMLW